MQTMQNKQDRNKKIEDEIVLEHILLKPSGTLRKDRFNSETLATCGANCSGECHGFIS